MKDTVRHSTLDHWLRVKSQVGLIGAFANDKQAENVDLVPRPDRQQSISKNWALQNSYIERSLDSLTWKSHPQHFVLGKTGRHVTRIILISEMHCPRRRHEREQIISIEGIITWKGEREKNKGLRKCILGKHYTHWIHKQVGTIFAQAGTHSTA